MLQVDPPPKAVKVTMSKRVPLVGDELKAYDEEQEKIKKEEAVKKASIIKVEEVRAASSHLSESSKGDSMMIDPPSAVASSEGILLKFKILRKIFQMFPCNPEPENETKTIVTSINFINEPVLWMIYLLVFCVVDAQQTRPKCCNLFHTKDVDHI